MTGRYILSAEEEALYRRARRIINPSIPMPWEGAYADGARYSCRQLRELDRLGLDAETIDFVDVEVPGDPRRIYIPHATYFYRRVACPIVGHSGDRLRVISPDAYTKLVYPNGQLTRKRAS